jgi:hypothetical protein
MSKVVSLPISAGSGLLAGLLGKKLFGVLWRVIDDQEPPNRNIETPLSASSLSRS